MIKITDQSFRYTPSFNTDLKKKFRKLQQARRAAVARSTDSEADSGTSVVQMAARRNATKI